MPSHDHTRRCSCDALSVHTSIHSDDFVASLTTRPLELAGGSGNTTIINAFSELTLPADENAQIWYTVAAVLCVAFTAFVLLWLCLNFR